MFSLKQILPIQFHIKAFVWISLTFVLFTIVGTLSHELGHIAVARSFGFETTLHSGSMNYDPGLRYDSLNSIWKNNQEAIRNNEVYPEKEYYEQLVEEWKHVSIYITLGGPLQTILTGTMGLVILAFRRKRWALGTPRIFDWIGVFLSLFWLRELANLVTGMVSHFIHPDKILHSDELALARWFQWPEWSLEIVLASIALLIGITVVFKVIPAPLRLTFISAGLAGGMFGYWFWLIWFGPIVMP